MNQARNQIENEIDTDRETQIELEVERRVRIREREIRERNSERGMKTAALGLYAVFALLLFAFSNHFWPEITRLAIIVMGGGAVTAVLFLAIGNLWEYKRTSGKTGWGLLGTMLGSIAVAIPVVTSHRRNLLAGRDEKGTYHSDIRHRVSFLSATLLESL